MAAEAQAALKGLLKSKDVQSLTEEDIAAALAEATLSTRKPVAEPKDEEKTGESTGEPSKKLDVDEIKARVRAAKGVGRAEGKPVGRSDRNESKYATVRVKGTANGDAAPPLPHGTSRRMSHDNKQTQRAKTGTYNGVQYVAIYQYVFFVFSPIQSRRFCISPLKTNA